VQKGARSEVARIVDHEYEVGSVTIFRRSGYVMIRLSLVLAVGIAGSAPAAEPARPLVFVVDGAGDLKGCSTALALTNADEGCPVELTVFPWSHGHRRLLLDQFDHKHAKEKGAALAEKLAETRRLDPQRRLVVVAHSAGCAVALAACSALPCDAVDRVVLLAPSVSKDYDVRPALKAAREGFDVYCSERDWIALGLVLRVVRTTDRLRSAAAAGRYGFQPKALAEEESPRLRNHFWSPDLAWTGHNGRHHGMHAPLFLKTYLFPLFSDRDVALRGVKGAP